MSGRRRTVVIAVCVVAVVSVGAVAAALAESWPPVTWNSPFVIQNMGNDDATIVAQFYTMGNGLQHTEPCPLTAPGDNCTIRPYTIPDGSLPPGEKYSVVLYSDEPVASIINIVSDDGRLGAYAGSTPISNTAYFPNFNKNYADWNTPLYIQNAGSSATTIGLEFFPVGGGAVYHSMTSPSMSPGASYEFEPADHAGLSDGAYSVKATATDPAVDLAAMTVQLRPGAGEEMAVNAFTSGADTLYCPNINKNYGAQLWTTPVVIQNMGSSPISVTVKYYAVTVPGYGPGDFVNSWAVGPIQPGLSGVERPHVRDDTDLPPGAYSMKIEGPGASELAAIVNQVRLSGTGQAMAYGCFSAGGTTVFLPNINRNYGGENWNTPFVIQNVGGASADVLVEYIQAGAVAKTLSSADDPTLLVPPGGASAQRPHATAGLANGKYSVRITSQGGSPPPLVAIVNQVGSVDGAAAVEGIAK